MDVIRGKFPNSSVHPSLCSLQTLNVFFPFCFSIWFTLNTTLKQKHSGTTEKNQFVCSHLSSACWDSFVRFSFITRHVSVHRERKSQGHPRIAPVHQAGCVCVCVLPPLLHLPSFPSSFEWKKKKMNTRLCTVTCSTTTCCAIHWSHVWQQVIDLEAVLFQAPSSNSPCDQKLSLQHIFNTAD